ncbi:heme ABC exporter ATP-binding protein CcmA [uncultured Planktomarina sp.]|jgi:heme exporter protein A|uniref:heme ABC exporter ATP-binding protein CcmA n=1 Tax=uncultured Planktomarina sp. TaxID=1538529 RepID=UPI00325FF648
MLHVSNLSVARGGMTLLSGVDFALNAGQILVLRGANGLGKTSLLRCIAGLQNPVEGQITAPETVAYSGHADGLKGQMTVLENLAFWSSIYHGPSAEVALDAYDLHALADRPAANLSAGQKRRLGLARMQVSGCALWVMDEPTVSLDADNVALFRAALDRHVQSGGAAVITSHIDLAIASARLLDLTRFKARGLMGSTAFEEALE